MGEDEGGVQDSEDRLRDLLDQTARGSRTGFIALVIGKGLAFLFQTVLARFLGPAKYGLFALGRAIENLGESIGELGAGTGVVRFVSQKLAIEDEEEAASVFQAAVAIALVGSTFITLGLYFSSPFLADWFNEPGLTTILRYFSLALPSYTLLTVVTSLAQARKRITHQQGVLRVLSPLFRLSFVGGALLVGWGLGGAVLGFAASGLASLLVAVYLSYRVFPRGFGRVRWLPKVRGLLGFSIPVLLTGLTATLALRVDRILLGYLGTSTDVGIYQAGAVIGLNLSIAHAAVTNIMKPMISESYESDPDQFETLYRTAARWSTASTFVMLLPLLVFPDVVLSIFGSEFDAAVPVLIALLLWQQISTINGTTGAALKMTGHQNIELANGIFFLSAIIGLDLLLIPRFGPFGAALGTLAATTAIEYIRVFEIQFYHGFHPYSRSHLMLLAVIGVLGISGFLASSVPSLWLRAGLLVLLFGATIAVYRFLATEEDWRLVSTLVE